MSKINLSFFFVDIYFVDFIARKTIYKPRSEVWNHLLWTLPIYRKNLHLLDSGVYWRLVESSTFLKYVLLPLTKKRSPGLTKHATHTTFIYEKTLIIHFSRKSISTEDCMKVLCIVILHTRKLFDKHFPKNQKLRFLKFGFWKFLGCVRNQTQVTKPWFTQNLSHQRFDLLAIRMHWKRSES